MIAIMVLLLPLASAISSPSSSALPELDVNGLEVVLTLEGDIWTQEAWMDLETRGLVPLRVLSENSVLVWSEEGILPSSEFELRIADKAEWRGDGAGSVDTGAVGGGRPRMRGHRASRAHSRHLQGRKRALAPRL